MEDARIIDLYWTRSEDAIAETAAKYGNYCYAIAYRILSDTGDAEESVNDTYLDAWNSMPPHRPAVLAAFLGKITRRVAIDRWRGRTAEKRGGGAAALALEELADCVPAGLGVEQELDARELAEAVNAFVMSLPLTERRVFLRRYWYLDPIPEISRRFGFSESKVKMMLHRQRRRLLARLEREAFFS